MTPIPLGTVLFCAVRMSVHLPDLNPKAPMSLRPWTLGSYGLKSYPSGSCFVVLGYIGVHGFGYDVLVLSEDGHMFSARSTSLAFSERRVWYGE